VAGAGVSHRLPVVGVGSVLVHVGVRGVGGAGGFTEMFVIRLWLQRSSLDLLSLVGLVSGSLTWRRGF